MVKSLLSEQDAREVEEAVRSIEKRSATEVVVAVLPKSADYLAWRVILAVGWALGATFVVHYVLPELSAVWLLLLEPVIGVAIFFLSGWEPIYRNLIPPDAAARAVDERAFALFAEHGVHRTRDRTGLLVLVSELEHRVVILGDSGIHQRMGEKGWEAEVAYLVTRIRERKTKEGLLEVLRHFEPILAEAAPVRTDDTNELPDAVVRG